MKKTKEFYLSNIQIDNIVAFNVGNNMYSGKIVSITYEDEKYIYVIKTKNGSVYYVDRKDVVWVKNGSYWPTGIFNALKETKSKI